MKKILLSAVAVMATVFATQAQCSVSYTAIQDTVTREWTVNINRSDPTTTVHFDWGDSYYVAGGDTVLTHTYNNGASYIACVNIVNSANNCWASYCDTLTSLGFPSTCTVSYTSMQDTVTGEWTVNINSSNSNASVSFDWGDSFLTYTSSGGSITHTYSTNGAYQACVSISDSVTNCYATFCDSIVVGSSVLTPPPASGCNASFYMYKDSSIADTWNLALSAIDSSATLTFSWGDSTISTITASNLAGFGHAYANAGVYTVCLTVAIDSTCSNTYCDTLSAYRLNGAVKYLNVKPAPSTITALNKALPKKLTVSLVPNPATSTFTINGVNANEIANVQIMDLAGKTLLNTRNTTLTISDLNAGMYLVNVTTTNGVSTISKLIKE